MRNYLFEFILAGIFIVGNVFSAHAYTMADYWSFGEGDIWIYDRDFIAIGKETHSFGTYNGKEYLEAREYCKGHFYINVGPDGILFVGIYSLKNDQFINLSATPIKLSDVDMNVGDSYEQNFPAGVLDIVAIRYTFTLEAVETVTVPAGTFNNTLRMQIVIEADGIGVATEKVWLAKGIGAVQMQRVSETNNYLGCIMTCGSYNCDGDAVDERYIQLRSYIKGRKGAVVIPLL